MKVLFNCSFFIGLALASVSASANDCATSLFLNSSSLSNPSAIAGNLAGAGSSAPAQCNGPANQDDVWYRFTAVTSNTVVAATGGGDLDLAIELFDACGGSLIACVNNTGAGQSESTTATGLNVGNLYYVRVYHGSSAPNFNTTFTISASHVPIVELLSQDCGEMDYTTNDIIKSTQPQNTSGVQYYQWRFEELEAPFTVYERISPNGTNPNYRLQWFSEVEYGRSYSVSVRLGHAPGGLLGDYGASCIIGLQDDVVSTQLQEDFASLTYRFCDVIAADAVGAADKYNWSFFDLNTTILASGKGNSRFLRIQDIPGVLLQKTYIVSATATVNGQTSPVGIQRFISTSNTVPPTRLRNDLTPCGSTVPINTQVQAVEICKASSYTWRFQNTSSPQPVLMYTRVGGSRFIRLDWVAGLNVGNSYNVSIRANQGGKTGTYSTVCNITIGESTALLQSPDQLIAQNFLTNEAANVLEIDLLSQSGDGNFGFQIFSSLESDEQIIATLYDLNGRVVGQKREFLYGGTGTYNWSEGQLSQGIYILSVQAGSITTSKKIAIF